MRGRSGRLMPGSRTDGQYSPSKSTPDQILAGDLHRGRVSLCSTELPGHIAKSLADDLTTTARDDCIISTLANRYQHGKDLRLQFPDETRASKERP